MAWKVLEEGRMVSRLHFLSSYNTFKLEIMYELFKTRTIVSNISG